MIWTRERDVRDSPSDRVVSSGCPTQKMGTEQSSSRQQSILSRLARLSSHRHDPFLDATASFKRGGTNEQIKTNDDKLRVIPQGAGSYWQHKGRSSIEQ